MLYTGPLSLTDCDLCSVTGAWVYGTKITSFYLSCGDASFFILSPPEPLVLMNASFEQTGHNHRGRRWEKLYKSCIYKYSWTVETKEKSIRALSMLFSRLKMQSWPLCFASSEVWSHLVRLEKFEFDRGQYEVNWKLLPVHTSNCENSVRGRKMGGCS